MAVLTGVSHAAEPLALCFAPPHAVAPDVRSQWQQELRLILHHSGYELKLAACTPESIELRVLRSNPRQPQALGAARTSQSRIEPVVEIYLDPLAELIGTRLAGPLGRAMARVTAHELRHVVGQQAHHQGGDFPEGYSAGLLLAAKPAHFRIR